MDLNVRERTMRIAAIVSLTILALLAASATQSSPARPDVLVVDVSTMSIG